ncbi:rhodanese-like domain-containing protein [Pseudodesulfovibrio tunisiensis]|uniref:rhodanese-like domain-containing protein n=1 Tax=Pseudodesulfovibrio tunisiensis TaxID=463192 RepID=UPI001FB4D949|nr:rhodanese-like domain-containing protein [Pseudodesulfovibrio tunisiensis]
MERIDEILSEMDFDFFGTGEHAVPADVAAKLAKEGKAFFLDVRTREEVACLEFPFAVNIPLHELPARIDELPKDKLIVVFCAAIFRGAMAYTYLLHKGFDEVKGVSAPTEALATQFKPGPLYKLG